MFVHFVVYFLQTNRNFIIDEVKNIKLLTFVPSNIQCDIRSNPDIMLAIMEECVGSLEYATGDLLANREFILAAVMNNNDLYNIFLCAIEVIQKYNLTL